MPRAKRTFIHWLKKAFQSQEVRDGIRSILVNPDHKHYATILKIVLPFVVVETVKGQDGWSLKLPKEEITEVTVESND